MMNQDVITSSQKVLLADVKTLTFMRDRLTSSRRLAPMPQLICDSSGGSAGCSQPRYQVETAMCKNRGLGDDGRPRWECSADLPSDIALSAVEVSCEGFRNREDPYVLVGSCSLTYSLDFSSRFYDFDAVGGGFKPASLIYLVFFGAVIVRVVRGLRKPRRRPPPAYTEPPASEGYSLASPCAVTGEPVLATAVPVNDIENAASATTIDGQKGTGSKGIATGLPGPVAAAPMAHAVEMAEVDGAQATDAGRTGRSPPHRVSDLPLPEGWEGGVDPETDPREDQWRRLGREGQNDAQGRRRGGRHARMPMRASGGFVRPFGFGMFGGFALARGLMRGSGMRRPFRRPGFGGGGFGRLGGSGGGGGGGVRSAFGGTANR